MTCVLGAFEFVELFDLGRLGNILVTSDDYERSSKKSVSPSLCRDRLHSRDKGDSNRTGYSHIL
jgi:hypothetical protein